MILSMTTSKKLFEVFYGEPGLGCSMGGEHYSLDKSLPGR